MSCQNKAVILLEIYVVYGAYVKVEGSLFRLDF